MARLRTRGTQRPQLQGRSSVHSYCQILPRVLANYQAITMCRHCRYVPGHEYMVRVTVLEEIACVTLNGTQIAMSVFATKNEDRFELTYREFANVSNVRIGARVG